MKYWYLLVTLLLILLFVGTVSATVVDIYPTGNGDVKRNIGTGGGTWVNIRNGDGTTITTGSAGCYIAAHTTSNVWIQIDATGMGFNLSTVPAGSTINSITLHLWGRSKSSTFTGKTFSAIISSVAPTDWTTWAASDYQKRSGTAYSDTITYAGWATGQYNNITLNADAIAFFQGRIGTNASIIYRNGWDFTNTSSNWVANGEAQMGTYTIEQTGTANDPFITMDYTSPDTTPPASITNLTNVTTSTIDWEWDNPADADFDVVQIFQNGIFLHNVTTNYDNWTDLACGTEYTISTHTCDETGNCNTTWVNQTAITSACADTTPPGTIQGLGNSTTTCEQITWGWQSPSDSDFNHTMIYKDGIFLYNLSNTTYGDIWTGLTGGQEYTFSSHTVDITGNVDPDWMNMTAIPTSCGAIPVANFTADSTSVCIGDTIHFNDTSEWMDESVTDYFAWDFGDGNTTEGYRSDGYDSPEYIYSFADVFTVTMEATNKYGSNTSTKTDYIEVSDCSLTADFSGNITCQIGAPMAVLFTGYCPYPNYKNHWIFGDGNTTDDVQSPEYTYYDYGVFNVSHSCKLNATTTLFENKTDYIIVGVNGTYCTQTGSCTTDTGRVYRVGDNSFILNTLGGLICIGLIFTLNRRKS